MIYKNGQKLKCGKRKTNFFLTKNYEHYKLNTTCNTFVFKLS